jgi:hypothetical protein
MLETVAAFLLVLGGWGAFKSIRALARGHRSHHWPSAPGHVRKVEVFKKFNRRSQPVARQEVAYSYEVGAAKYQATRLKFGVPGRFSWFAEPFVPFRRGERVDVVHDPDAPAVSALDRGYSPFAFITLLGASWIFWMGVRMLMA